MIQNKSIEKTTLSRTKQIAAKVIYETFKILKEAGGQLPGREVVEQIEKRVPFTPWELERYQKTGYIRWQSILHFYTIDCIKAGFLRKQSGIWILTSEGEKALKLSPVALLDHATTAYRVWHDQNKNSDLEIEEKPVAADQLQKANINLLQEQALDGLREHIKKMNPYEFQDLIAALLRAMGHYISFIAPRGKDGGIDIIAYQDPLGAMIPRIKVQVKHKPNDTVAVGDVKSLMGSLNKEGDVGLFVTSGHFSPDAQSDAIPNIV